MSDLADLYQEIILNHNRRPRNEGELSPCNCRSEGYNPLCGDRITVNAELDDDSTLVTVRFLGEGCAISRASASIMTTMMKDLSREEAFRKITAFSDMLTSNNEPEADLEILGDLAALIGVRRFPARIKCATLAWHALGAALRGEEKHEE